MGLCVRPHLATGTSNQFGHPRKIGLEAIEIDHQGGRRQFARDGFGIATDEMAVGPERGRHPLTAPNEMPRTR